MADDRGSGAKRRRLGSAELADVWRHAILTRDPAWIGALCVEGLTTAQRESLAQSIAKERFSRALAKHGWVDVFTHPPCGLHELPRRMRIRHRNAMLVEAAGCGHLAFVQTMLEAAPGEAGLAPESVVEAMRCAAAGGHTEVFLYMWQRRPALPGHLVQTLVEGLAQHGCRRAVEVILRRYECLRDLSEHEIMWAPAALCRGLSVALRHGQRDVIDMLLQSKAAHIVKGIVSDGSNLFYMACARGCLATLESLRRYLQQGGWGGMTSHAAIMCMRRMASLGRVEILRKLLFGCEARNTVCCEGRGESEGATTCLALGPWRAGAHGRLLPSVMRGTGPWDAPRLEEVFDEAVRGRALSAVRLMLDEVAWAAAMPRKVPWWTQTAGHRAIRNGVLYAARLDNHAMIRCIMAHRHAQAVPGIGKALDRALIACIVHPSEEDGGLTCDALCEAAVACVRFGGHSTLDGMSEEMVRLVRRKVRDAAWSRRRSMLLLRTGRQGTSSNP